MSSQLSISLLHMTCFSSWLSGDFVSKLANFREAVSKMRSIVVRRATAPDEVAAKKRSVLASARRLAISTLLIVIVRLK